VAYVDGMIDCAMGRSQKGIRNDDGMRFGAVRQRVSFSGVRSPSFARCIVHTDGDEAFSRESKR
jgi:hypothetical protein